IIAEGSTPRKDLWPHAPLSQGRSIPSTSRMVLTATHAPCMTFTPNLIFLLTAVHSLSYILIIVYRISQGKEVRLNDGLYDHWRGGGAPRDHSTNHCVVYPTGEDSGGTVREGIQDSADDVRAAPASAAGAGGAGADTAELGTAEARTSPAPRLRSHRRTL